MKTPPTVDVRRWVEEHRALLPRTLMSHERIWNDGFLVMLFDGPTAADRSDFHINSCPEFFYQFVGEMRCRVLEDGRFVDFVVKEGEMFLLPPLVPHLNTRGDHSIGLVVHQARPEGATDAIAWYCESCGHQLRRVDYMFSDLKSQLTEHVSAFLADEKARTCSACGTVMPATRGAM